MANGKPGWIGDFMDTSNIPSKAICEVCGEPLCAKDYCIMETVRRNLARGQSQTMRRVDEKIRNQYPAWQWEQVKDG
jgi:hypothetical protein